MGLDMYLEGHIFHMGVWKDGKRTKVPAPIDGFDVKETRLEVGYWRKHPDLHGYIINTFADGVDECQEIELGPKELAQIVIAIKNNDLPKTSGFFFGESEGADYQDSTAKLTRAIEWLNSAPEDGSEWRSIVYRASW